MFKSQEEINTFNESIKDFSKTCKGVNYTQLLTAPAPHISITAKYHPLFTMNKKQNIEFAGLDENLNVVLRNDIQNYYFGVSPNVSAKKIFDGVKNFTFNNTLKLDSFIKEHHKDFMVHIKHKNDLLAFSRYIVMSMTNNYGAQYIFEDKSMLKEFLLKLKDLLLEDINFFKDDKTEFLDRNITLYGCPLDIVINELEKYSLSVSNKKIFVNRKTNENLSSLKEIYANTNVVKLVKTKAFYSGTLLRVRHIEIDENDYSGDSINNIKIIFERTTYGTVYACENNAAIFNPILANDFKQLIDFFENDDKLLEKYLFSTSPENLHSNFNKYINQSALAHQIGVSGNIITKEDYLLIGYRGVDTIDEGFLYPSVNGNAESYDSNVSFYRDSVYEDLPSIKIDNMRIDFNAELCREGYAELQTNFQEQEWVYLGVGILAIDNRSKKKKKKKKKNEKEEEVKITKRRLHINILAEQKTNYSLKEVRASQHKAVEKFEAESIWGFDIPVQRSFLSYMKNFIEKGLKILLQSKNFITSILTLFLFFSTRALLAKNNISLNQITSLVFAIAVLLSTVFEFLKIVMDYYKNKKYTKKTSTVFVKNKEKHLNKIFDAVAKTKDPKTKSYLKFLPLTMMMLRLHAINKANSK